jgi:hypothetical protein
MSNILTLITTANWNWLAWLQQLKVKSKIKLIRILQTLPIMIYLPSVEIHHVGSKSVWMPLHVSILTTSSVSYSLKFVIAAIRSIPSFQVFGLKRLAPRRFWPGPNIIGQRLLRKKSRQRAEDIYVWPAHQWQYSALWLWSVTLIHGIQRRIFPICGNRRQYVSSHMIPWLAAWTNHNAIPTILIVVRFSHRSSSIGFLARWSVVLAVVVRVMQRSSVPQII